MSVSQFLRILPDTLREEGGLSNDANDPGGLTKWGVTHLVYDTWRRDHGLPRRSVRDMTKTEMEAIYAEGYYRPINGDSLPCGVARVAFDLSVNSGPGRARKYLAATAALASQPVQRIHAISAMRLSFLHGLRTWKFFGRGWAGRVARIEALALKDELSPVQLPVEAALKAARAGSVAKRLARAGHAASATAVTAPVTKAADVAGGAPGWLIAALVAAAVVAALVIYLKSRQQAARMTALADIAQEQ